MAVYSHILPIHRMLLQSVNSTGGIHRANGYVNILHVLVFQSVAIGLIYYLLTC